MTVALLSPRILSHRSRVADHFRVAGGRRPPGRESDSPKNSVILSLSKDQFGVAGGRHPPGRESDSPQNSVILSLSKDQFGVAGGRHPPGRESDSPQNSVILSGAGLVPAQSKDL